MAENTDIDSNGEPTNDEQAIKYRFVMDVNKLMAKRLGAPELVDEA